MQWKFEFHCQKHNLGIERGKQQNIGQKILQGKQCNQLFIQLGRQSWDAAVTSRCCQHIRGLTFKSHFTVQIELRGRKWETFLKDSLEDCNYSLYDVTVVSQYTKIKNDRNGGVWQSGISKSLAEYVQHRVYAWKCRLFCLCAYGQCRVYYIYHVKFHFRFRRLVSFPV